MNRSDYKSVGLITLSTFFITTILAVHGVDPHHDGIVMKPAIDIANGKVLFRDSFTQYGIVFSYLQGAFVKLFGPYLLTIKLQTVLIATITNIFLFLIWRNFTTCSMALILSLIWPCLNAFFFDDLIGFHAWSTYYMVCSVVIGTYFMIEYINNENHPKYLFWSGFLFAAAFWIKQVGMLQLLASTLCAYPICYFKNQDFKKAAKHLCIYLLGLAFVFITIFAWLFFTDSLHDWWLQSIYFAKLFQETKTGQHNAIINLLRSMFLQPASVHNSIIWAIIPLCSLFWFCYDMRILVKFKADLTLQRNLKRLLLSSIGLVGWLQYYPINHIFHLHLFSSLLYVFVPISIFSSIRFLKISPRLKATTLIVIAFFSYDIIIRVSSLNKKLHKDYSYVENLPILKGLRIPKGDAQKYRVAGLIIKNAIESGLDDKILFSGADPLPLLFGNSESLLPPMYVNWTWVNGYFYPNYFKEFYQLTKENKYLIIREDISKSDGYVTKYDFKPFSPRNVTFFIMTPGHDITQDIDYIIRPIENPQTCVPLDHLDKFKLFEVEFSGNFENKEIESIYIANLDLSEIPEKIPQLNFEHYIQKLFATTDAPKFLNEFYHLDRGFYWLNENVSSLDKAKIATHFIDVGYGNIANYRILRGNQMSSYMSYSIDQKCIWDIDQPIISSFNGKNKIKYYFTIPTKESSLNIRFNFLDNNFADIKLPSSI